MPFSKETLSLLRYLYKKFTSFQLKTKHENHTIFLSLPGLYLIPLPITIQKNCVFSPKMLPTCGETKKNAELNYRHRLIAKTIQKKN